MDQESSKLDFNTDWQYSEAPESTDHIRIDDRYDLFIGGDFVAPRSGKYFNTINPAREEVLSSVALADGIAYLLTDRAMRDGLARNAVRLIETDFDADREANAFAELYGALIAERRAGRP